MKKGITLLELVMAVAILAPLLLLAASLDYTALRELPCAAALTQTSLRMQNMLHALRQDVESADSLQLNGQSVELHGKAGLTTYSRNGGNFTRTVQRPQEKADVRTWLLPEADIQWKAWNEKGRNYALEVRTGLIVRENGQPRKKLANSQVFHLGADGSSEAVK